LTGALDAAEKRLSLLSKRARNIADFAAVTASRLELYMTLNRSDRGVEVCLEYLRSVGIHWTPNPSANEVRGEYDRLRRRLLQRPIETLMDLPSMTVPRWRATMDVLSMLVAPAAHTDHNLLALTAARMGNLSLEHGNADGSCFAYVWLGMLFGDFFGDYQTGYRFGKVAFDLVNQRGPLRFKARVYECFGSHVVTRLKKLDDGIDLVRRAFETANETGDVNFASFSLKNLLLLRFEKESPLPTCARKPKTRCDLYEPPNSIFASGPFSCSCNLSDR